MSWNNGHDIGRIRHVQHLPYPDKDLFKKLTNDANWVSSLSFLYVINMYAWSSFCYLTKKNHKHWRLKTKSGHTIRACGRYQILQFIHCNMNLFYNLFILIPKSSLSALTAILSSTAPFLVQPVSSSDLLCFLHKVLVTSFL